MTPMKETLLGVFYLTLYMMTQSEADVLTEVLKELQSFDKIIQFPEPNT